MKPLSHYKSRSLSWWLKTPLYLARIDYRPIQRLQERYLCIWRITGKPNQQPSPYLKRVILRGYARKMGRPIFIETGTYRGDTIAALLPFVKRVISVELAPHYFHAAQERFHSAGNVAVLQGDSGELLPGVIQALNEPCLFWLDGHYSKDDTAKGEKETPIIKELNSIFQRGRESPLGIGKSTLLIDDAHCFGTWPDYPTIPELRTFVERE